MCCPARVPRSKSAEKDLYEGVGGQWAVLLLQLFGTVTLSRLSFVVFVIEK